MHSYHETHFCFPPGSTAVFYKGTNWRTHLPAVHRPGTALQQARLQPPVDRRRLYPTSGVNMVLNNLSLPVYTCPSSDLNPTVGGINNTSNLLMHMYVGIMGSTPTPPPEPSARPATTAASTSTTEPCCVNEITRIRDMSDGSSQHHGHRRDRSGRLNGVTDVRSAYYGGWAEAAVRRSRCPPATPPGADSWSTGVTGVMYSINYRTYGASIPGEANSPYDANTILNSFHTPAESTP